MAIFTNRDHPEQRIAGPAGTVRFVGGRAEVGEAQAEALRALPAEWGIVEEVSEEEAARRAEARRTPPPPSPSPPRTPMGPDDPEPPARNASTENWRAYAVARGMSPEEAGKRSRDDLVAEYLGGS